MICKLCHEDKKLIKRSHIIPDFMYKGIKNEKNQIMTATAPDFIHKEYIPTGYYDQYILCDECEHERIGDYESYGAKVLSSGKDSRNKPLQVHGRSSLDGIKTIHIQDIDYTKFKLFLLSILWRASISKRQYFKEVKLGSHEEILRKAILYKNPLDEEDYQISIMIYTGDINLPKEFIVEPRQIKFTEDPSFCFYINGAFYFYTTEKNPKLEIYQKSRIRKNNEIEIPLISLEIAKMYLNKFWMTNF